MTPKRIGFVGAGLMGSSLVKHLLAGGFSVIVHDIDATRVEAMVNAGAKKADSPRDIASQVDVVMLSLPNSSVVNDVVGDMGLTDSGREGLIVIDTTTADPRMSQELAAQLGDEGIEMLDATISGTSEMCAVKDIIFMVGGKEKIFRECRPIFAALGKEAIYMGANGAGAVVKLVVNLVLGLNRMALAEGLTLARKAGVEPLQALEVLRQSAAFSKIMDQKGYRMVNKQFMPAAGKLELYYKDVRLMLALGASLDCPLPLISLHAQALASAVSKGRGEWDSAAIISFYDELAGFKAARADARPAGAAK